MKFPALRLPSALRAFSRLLLIGLAVLPSAWAAPVAFDIPASPAPAALDLFIKQSGAQVTYLRDDVKDVRTNAVTGSLEPRLALERLVKGTGLDCSERKGGQFTVGRIKPGGIDGSLLDDSGRPIVAARVTLGDEGQSVLSDRRGRFAFGEVAAGVHALHITAEGLQSTRVTDVEVKAGQQHSMSPVTIPQQKVGTLRLEDFVVSAKKNDGVVELDPYAVSSTKQAPFTGNMDIPRTIDDAQAYYIFDTQAIDHSGAANLEGFLKRSLPMQTQATTGEQGIAINGARANVNLRGLGAAQTLILVNGRRSATSNNGNASTFSVNSIPLGAIDRVEVLPSSASAIYGSSAVGGVINIVLKRNYSGGEIKATYQTPFDTDAPMRRLDLSYGFSLEGGRTQVMLSAGYSNQETLQSRDRQDIIYGYAWRARQNYIAATGNLAAAPAWLGATPNIVNGAGNVSLVLKPAYGGGSVGSALTYVPYGVTLATSPTALGASLVANAGQVNRDLADTNQIPLGLGGDIGTSPTLKSFMATFRREMTPTVELNAEFSYTGDYNKRNSSGNAAFSVPAAAVTNPFTTAVTVNLPLIGLGDVSSSSISRRLSVGAIVHLPHDWLAQADYTWSTSTLAYRDGGTLWSSTLDADIRSGVLNPFVDTTRLPFDLSRYMGTQSWSGEPGTLKDAALRLTGPVGELPAGTPDLTIGLEHRKDGYGDAYAYNVYPNFPAENGTTFSPSKKSEIDSAYLETKVPLIGKQGVAPFIRDISLQAAWRLENFKIGTGTNSVTILPVPATPPVLISSETSYRSANFTYGITWHPLKSLMFRASVSDGFVPPTYTQLITPTLATTTTTVSDPLRGRAPTPVFVLSGGNPNLRPESSKTTAVGLVFEPVDGALKGLRLGVDYNFIDKRDNIATLSAQVMVDNEAAFPDRITRGPLPAGDAFSVGPITRVNTGPVNLLRAYYESVDASLRYRKNTASLGNFEFSALGTFGLQAARKTVINTPFVDFAGYVNFPLSFTGSGSLYWDYHRYSVGWSTRYIPSVHAIGPPTSTSLLGRQRLGGEWVSPQIYHDLSFSYRFPFTGRTEASDGRGGFRSFAANLLSGVELQLAVYNLFDRAPAFDPSSSTLVSYSTYGDIRLREFRLSIKKPF